MPEESKPTGVKSALGSLVYDVCGPTARYIGDELRNYAEVGVSNLKRVFSHADNRLRLLDKAAGQVPPRVLQGVLTAGYFCEDDLQAVYLGGVLASSRGPTSRDDRGVAYLSILEGLSSYQIRTHFILYSSILRAKNAYIGNSKISVNFAQLFRHLITYGATVCIAESDYQTAMDFSSEESPEIIAEHCFIGLQERGLSEGGIHVYVPRAGPTMKKGEPPQTDPPFRYIYPTKLGIELFLWGLGRGDSGIAGYSPALLEMLGVSINVEPFRVEYDKVGY